MAERVTHGLLEKTKHVWKSYSGTAMNTALVLTTGGLQQLTTKATFQCSCEEELNCSAAFQNQSLCPSSYLNVCYSAAFFFGPAVLLWLTSLAANPKLWKIVTGFRKKARQENSQRFKIHAWRTVLEITMISLLSPFAWMSVCLLDGNYLACALTRHPYQVDATAQQCHICQKVRASTEMSTEYRVNMKYSQFIGWLSVGSIAVVSVSVYCCWRCSHPLTYYHAKYYSLYRSHEAHEIDEEMSKQAQRFAEENVKKFISESRDKKLWDHISTVYSFHRGRNKQALYSYLHQWVKEEEEKERNSRMDKLEPWVADMSELENGSAHQPDTNANEHETSL